MKIASYETFRSLISGNRTVSLRYLIILPIVLLILCSTTIVVLLSLQNGRMAVNDVAAQLRSGVLERVEERLAEYLQIPMHVNKINAYALESGLLDTDNIQNVQRYFYHIIKTYPSLAYSFFGTPEGEFYGARRLPDGDIQIVRAGNTTNGNSHNFSTNRLGDALELKQVYKNFDPRLRPWYQAGVTAAGAAWTPIYRHFVVKDLALTAAQPCYSSDGALKGVFGVDYVLGQINQFLQNIHVSEHGAIYIMDENGNLIAASSGKSDYLIKERNSVFAPVPAVNSGLALVEASARLLLKDQTDGLRKVDHDKLLTFEQNGKRQYLQATEFTRIIGLRWILVTVVPESDFMAGINNNTRNTFAIVVLVALLSICLGIFMASNVAAPIEQFSRDAEKLAQGDFERKSIVHTYVKEIANLDLAFQAMNIKLQCMFIRQKKQSDIIAEQNEQLEKIVEERTAELKDANIRLKAFFENIPGHINVVDKEFNIIAVSRGLLENFGLLDMDSVLGLKCYEVFQGNGSPCIHCSLPECYSTRHSVVRYSVPEEEKVTGRALQIYSGPILDENNKVIGGIEYMSDISALRDLEKELIKARERAESANHAKSVFLANMSHEIRTPMNAIINMIRLLMDGKLDDDQKEYAKTAMLSSEIMLSLIDNILDFSKIEAGKLELENRDFNLQDTVESVVKILKLKAEKKGLYLTHKIEPNVYPYLTGDPVRLRQILLNLLNNAVKFTEKGGITLRVSLENGGTISENEKATHIKVKFEITDTGIGISEDHIDRLFQSFSQEDVSISRRYGGSGLGLAISKQLVELMRGEVGVVSKKDKGSTFRFTVKFRKSFNSNVLDLMKEDKSYASFQTLNPFKTLHAEILLAEDNVMNQKVALAILSRFGFLVDIVNNGKEAVESLNKKSYDLVLMDMQMPEMDGIEATEIIRNSDSDLMNQNVPIVAMTANASKEDRQKCFDAGMDGYIAKPVDPDELLSVIIKHIRIKSEEENELTDLDSSSFFATDNLQLTSEPPALFDQQDFLNRLGGDETVLKELLPLIPKLLFEGIKNLRSALEKKDAKEIRFYAHAIKGTSANFSAKRLSKIAHQIECAGAEGITDPQDSLMERLEQEAVQLISLLSDRFPDIFEPQI